MLYAIGAACGWGSYILLSKTVGGVFDGLQGLSMSLLAAAIVSLPLGLAGGVTSIAVEDVPMLIGLAILVPLLPYALEMTALKRMKTGFFSILMSLEPAMAAAAGFLILHQALTPWQIAGTLLVVSASVGAALLT